MTEDEWKAIPEIGDYTIKRRKRFETFSANSDSALAGALATATGNTGTVAGGDSSAPGFMTDLTALGQGRKQMLGVNLDRMADSVSGQTTVDPTGYLTSLNSKKVRGVHVLCAVCCALGRGGGLPSGCAVRLDVRQLTRSAGHCEQPFGAAAVRSLGKECGSRASTRMSLYCHASLWQRSTTWLAGAVTCAAVVPPAARACTPCWAAPAPWPSQHARWIRSMMRWRQRAYPCHA